MSGRKSKKNQRLGSSRRGPKGLNRNIEKDDNDGFQQIAESEDGRDEFHTTSATQFDHLPSSSIEQQTSELECPPHARGHKDSLMETDLPERKRKMGSTRKSTGRFKGDTNLDDVRTTEELDDEHKTQPNTSTTEKRHASLTEQEHSSFPSDVSLQNKSSGFGKESGTTLMFAVSENKEITSLYHEVLSDMLIDEAVVPSVHSVAVTVAEHDLLREDSVMFNEPKTIRHQETQIASTSGQKKRMGSTRRPLGEQNSENVGVQEHSRNMTENERKAEVMGEAKMKMSEVMAQTWDDVARDDPSSHTESAFLFSQSLLADRAELKELGVVAGTETMNQSVAFPLVDSEKPLPETYSHHGTPLLNEALDFEFGSHTDDLDVVNKVLEEAGSHLSYNSQHVSDARKDTNPSYDLNTEAKKGVLMQKEKPQLEELALHDQESSLIQHDIATLDNSHDCSMVRTIVGGSRSFDMPVSNISHAEPTTPNLPHEMRNAVEERQEIDIEIKQENNVCNVSSVTCDTLTDLVSVTEEDKDPHILATRENENMSNERGSETEYALKITDQCDARDHSVTQIILDVPVRDNEKDVETSTETTWISHQKPCDVSTEKEELYKGQEHYSLNISLTHSPTQDGAGKMLENEEVRKDQKETENTAVNDVTSNSDSGSHAHQQLIMQFPDKEGYDLHENVNDKDEMEGIFLSVESENAAFDRGNERSEGTDRNKEMDAALVLKLDVGDADLHLQIEAQNKTLDSTNSEANGTEENISGTSVLVRENKIIKNTVESNMTKSDFPRSSPDGHMEALNVSENAKKDFSGETDTILKQSDISIIPADSHREETHSKSSPVIQKRKMGSTRRPLKGKTGQRKGHDEKEIFNLEDEPSPEESRNTTVSICDISESQTFTNIPSGSYENIGDVEIVPAEGDTESHSEQKTFDSTAFEEEAEVREVLVIGDAVTVVSNMTTESDLHQTFDANMETLEVSENPEDISDTLGNSQSEIQQEIKMTELSSEAERTEDIICEASVSVRKYDFTVDTVTLDSNMTTDSDMLQSDTLNDAKLEALKLSKNTESVSAVTDSVLLGQDDVTEGSRETDTLPEQSRISVIPDDSHGEEAHSVSSLAVHKRKMGSTRRPLKGNKGQRKETKHQDENETLDSEDMISAEKQTFSLEDEPSPEKSTLQSTKDGTKEQEMEICEKNDVEPVEESESASLQSSSISDLVSEEFAAISICHLTESQTLTNINVEPQENTGDTERVAAEEDKDSQLETDAQNKTSDSTTSEAEETEKNIQDVNVALIKKVEVIEDTVTVASNMTTESDFIQTSPDAHMEALKISKNAEKEVSGETDTVAEQSDISFIPADSHREETHSKSSPVIQKRKMGSTRRPLKGNKGQRKETERHDENETLDSEDMISAEKQTFSLEDEPSPEKSTLQSTKDGAKEQEMEICEKNDVEPVEESESALLQSSTISDLVSEEFAAISICHLTESQTLTNINVESQENTGDTERVAAEEDKDLQLEIDAQNKTSDSTTSEAEETEKNRHDATVSVREVEVIRDTDTVESNEGDLLQSDTLNDAKLEALKLSKNTESVSAVTDSVLLGQDDITEGSRETDTLPEQSRISVIPDDSHGEEAHSVSSLAVHKRKMGSTRRPLKGNKGQRKETKHHDENELLDSEDMISAEKQTFSLEDEPSPEKSTLQSTKDGAKEQEMEICEKNDVEPVEESESASLQSSSISHLVSEEFAAISICHITESQSLTNIQVSQENTGDAERMAAEEDKDLQLKIDAQNKTSDSTTSEAEETEKNIQDVNVTLIKEVEVIGDTVTVASMTTESDFIQTSPDAHMEALKISKNAEKEDSGETDTVAEQSDISIIPADSHREETHSKSSPVIQKRKMGSTRRPLKGNKGQRKETERHDENETLDSKDMISAKSICHITESKTITNINVEPQENTGDAERMAAEEEKDLQLEIDAQNKTSDSTTSEAEETEKNRHDATVSVREVEVIGDTDTLESNETIESDFLQSSPDAHMEALKVSENSEKKVPGEIDTILKQSDISIIPADSHREETHLKSSPVIQKRKMGSTRRPLKGKTGQRKGHDEKQIFNLEDEPSPEESRYTTVSICDISESQTLTKSHAGSHENIGDVEIVPAEGDTESHSEHKTFDSTAFEEEAEVREVLVIGDAVTVVSNMTTESDLHQTSDANMETLEVSENPEDISDTLGNSQSEIQQEIKMTELSSEAERTEDIICEASVSVRKYDFTVDTVTLDSNMTTDSDMLQSDTLNDAKLEALKLSKNTESVSAVTDSVLLGQDDVTEGSRETDTLPEQSRISVIPDDSHGEEAHSVSSLAVHKRKMGSTCRPLKGNKGQRKETKHQDENKTLDSEDMISAEKKTFSLEDEPSPEKSTLQSTKDGTKEQEMEICKNNDVEPVEESESASVQSSSILHLVSEESTAISICHITQSQSLTNIQHMSQENTGDAVRMAAEEDKDSQLEIDAQNRTSDSTTSEAEETEKNIQDVNVTLIKEVEVLGDTVTVASMTTESDFIQTSPDAHMEALKISKNAEKEVSGETDTVAEQSDISIIPADSHREETHSKSSPVIQKRKMGSTRRPLKGNKGQRKETERHDENETLDSEDMISAEKQTFSLEDEPSPEKSTLQSTKDGAKEQEMEICEKNDVEPVEESESASLQSSSISDLVSEEFAAISICHITESQTLQNTQEVSQENTGDAVRVAAEEYKDSQLETDAQSKTSDSTTSEAEETDKNRHDATVSVREVEVIGDTDTVESNETIESYFLQTSSDANMEALKVSENSEKEVSEEADTILKQSDISIISADSHREETHSKSSPVIQKRKMGSTRRPLKGNKGQRKETERHDENETLDSEDMISAEKQTFSLEDEPSPEKSTLQSTKDGAKEQEMEICEKNDVEPVEESESALLQSSSISDLVSEESTAISICHITESQTITNINVEPQENTGDTERVAAEEDKDLQLEIDAQNKTSDSTTSEAEETEKNRHDATVSVREVEVIGDTDTLESNETNESDFLQSSPDAHMEALKVSENSEKEVSEETDIILKQSDISIIPADSHREETHSKSSPVIQKRKMGSTRRPLKGKTGQRKGHDEKEIFNLEDEPGPEESRNITVSICDISESQTLTNIHSGSYENIGDVEMVPAEGDTESHSEHKTFDSTAFEEEAEVREVLVIGDAVTVVSNMTPESDLHQTSDANMETLKVFENAEKEVSEETDTNLKQSDISIIPADSHREETHSKSSPVIQKRKMGSTRRPLKGNKGQRKETEHHDENETLDSEDMINAISICHMTESQTLTNIHAVTQESIRDAERVAAEEGKDLQLEIEAQNKTSDSTTSEAEEIEKNRHDATVSVREVEVIGDTDTLESNETNDSDLLQSDTLNDAKLEALKLSKNTESVSAVTDSVLLGQDDVTEGSRETDTLPEQSRISVIPDDSHGEEAHSVSSLTVHKRKMGSTRRPLKGNKGQRKETERHDENETLDSEDRISAEKQTFSLEDEPSPEKSTLQSTKDGAKEQEMEICEKNDVEPVEESESASLQSSSISDLVSEEFAAISICHLTESQAITNINVEPQENTGDTARVAAEEDKDLQLEIDAQNKTSDSTTSEAEETEKNIQDVNVTLIKEVEVIGDTVTVASNMTTESDFIQTSPDAHMEAWKISKNADKEVSGETDTVAEQSDISIIPADSHREETHSKSSPVIQKRKMGSTRRPLKERKGQRKETERHDENETLDSKDMISAKSICHITESQTITNINVEPQENTGDTERVAAEEDKDLQLEIDTQNKTSDSTTSEAEETEKNRHDATVSVREVEVIGDTDTLESNETIESDFLQSSPDAHMEALKVSENSEKEVPGETDTILKQSDISIIPADSHREETHSKSSPVIQKRKMGSTRRPLKGKTGQRKGHDEKEIFNLEDEPSPEESRYTTVSICDISESQTLTNIHFGSYENIGDVEMVPAEGDTESHSKHKTFDSTAFEEEAEVREVLVIGDAVTVVSNMTTESDLHQTSDANMETLKVFENAEKEVSEETDTNLKQSDISIIPADSHREETHSKSSPVIQKRKMGSTRRPLKGNKGQRKETEHHDENETLDSEDMINAISICHMTESQTLTNIHAVTQESIRDAERVAAEEGKDLQLEIEAQNKTSDSTTSEAEETEKNRHDATVSVREVEVIRDTDTVESNETNDSDLLQSDTLNDAKLEALKLSKNTESVSAVTDSVLLGQDDITEGSRETDTLPEQSRISVIPDDSHGEEAHSVSSLAVHKRKMGSTRRPLKGNKGQRKETKHHDENETLDSEDRISAEKQTFSLEDEPSPEKSTLQSTKDGAKEQEMEICEKNDVEPVEESKSASLQSSSISDLVSEESAAISICHITESQSLTNIQVSQENTGDAERMAAEEEKDLQLEIDAQNKTSDSTTSEAEETEKNRHDATVSVREVEVIGDTDTLESNETNESDFIQSSPDAHMEALKVSENSEKDVLGETDTILKQSDISIIPADSHREETHSKSSPVIQKRKMGSTRRPLKGKTGQRKGHDEKEIFNLEDEPSPEESRYTTVNICDISESQTLTKSHAGSHENIGDVEIVPAEGDTESHSEHKTFESTAFEEEGTEENICAATALDRKAEFVGDAVETNMTTESDLIQSYTLTDSKPEAFMSEIAKNKNSEKTDTISKQSVPNIIPEDLHGDEEYAKKLSLNVHKRKMGSTRRPLRGNKEQRKVRVESKENNKDSEGVSEEEDTETHSVIQNRDNLVDHNVTQEILNISDVKDEERKIMKTVDMSVQKQLDDLELEQRLDASQTQTGLLQDDTGSHLLEFPESTADFVRDSNSLSDVHVSDALLMEETQIYVSSNVPPTEAVDRNPVSKMSEQKRKMGSTRKRGKRMVNDKEVEDEKAGATENTITDDETTKSEVKLTPEEAITESSVHQQLFSSSDDKEGHDIQDIICKSDVQAENSEQNDPNSATTLQKLLIESQCSSNTAAEMVSDLPLGDANTYLDPKQSVIPKESHREDPVVQKRRMGSTRKTLRGNKGQGRIAESKKLDGNTEGMTEEQDAEPHLETKAKTELDEEVEQNFPVEFVHPVPFSNMFLEAVKEFSQNDLSEVSEEKGMDITGNDSEAINLTEGTKDKFVLTVSHKDIHQIVSEPEQTEITHKVIATQEKRRKMGSTRRNPRAMHGRNMADNEDVLGLAEDRETEKADNDLKEASSISQSEEVSSVSSTDPESEMLVGATDLKVENDHLHSSRPTEPETPENTLQICDNQVNANVTKHPQSETVSTEKRRKMGSTRKNPREGGIRGKTEGYEYTETKDTNLQMLQDSEMSLVREDVRKPTTHDYSNQSEDSHLNEIERALNKTSQSPLSCDWELITKEPNSDDLANTPDLNMPENSEIRSLQPIPSTHSEPNSPGGRRRKMGSTRKNPRQQLKAEREDEDKENGEIDENSKANKQEKKDLERVEVSVVHNITENKLNKDYLDVSSAHTSSNQLEESTNPVSQEKTSPSTKRKFGSRRANKDRQGFGRMADSDIGNELEDGDQKPDSSEVKDKLHSDDLAVCDPCLSLQPENRPASEQRNMEAKNEEATPKGTGAGLVSLDQIIKHDRSTGARQTVNLKNRIADTEAVQFNVVMVGNSCVGKTSFIRRFHEGQFTEDYRSTIGVDTCVQTVALPDKTVKLQIWDTAGQERFHSITTQVFHKADGLLLMYEITCSKSFISVRDWISQARERAPDDVIMMLLGNKSDSEKREVQIQEGADLAREYNIHFMECSAATGANVSESMMGLAEMLVQRKSQKEKHTTLRRDPPQKKSGCC